MMFLVFMPAVIICFFILSLRYFELMCPETHGFFNSLKTWSSCSPWVTFMMFNGGFHMLWVVR